MLINTAPLKFNAQQIEAIIDKVAPLIAPPELQGTARGLLHIIADESKSSAEFSVYIANLLERNAKQQRS
jgi:hypothetical protein